MQPVPPGTHRASACSSRRIFGSSFPCNMWAVFLEPRGGVPGTYKPLGERSLNRNPVLPVVQLGSGHLKKQAPLSSSRERWEGGRERWDAGVRLSVLSRVKSRVAGGAQGCGWVALMRAPELDSLLVPLNSHSSWGRDSI